VTVDEVAARVVEVLTRAETLFAPPGEWHAPAEVDAAAQTARAIAARSADLSGATAAGHRQMTAAAAGNLERASDADARLADALQRSAQLHDQGASQAAGLRAAAAEVPAQVSRWAELPVAQAAGLKTLRTQLAGMQRLLARHRAAAARTAAEISAVRYRPE
jgi:hypothetical protein